MTTFTKFERYIEIPCSFYRRSRDNLERVAELRDNRGMGLICAVIPIPGDKAHFHTNIKAIAKAYGLTQPTIIKIKMVGENSFTFSIRTVNLGQNRSPSRRHRATFGLDPFWISTMTDSKASGKQALQVLFILLPDKRVETWRLIWNKGISNMCHIGHGWYKFVQDYPLRPGHVVRFYISDDGSIIRVTVNDD